MTTTSFTSTRILSRSALGTTLLLIAIGGYTRGSGSGYGCEDSWPLCQDGLLGGVLPRAEYHMVVEWTHRWIAALVGLLAIATAVAAWRRHREESAIVAPAVAAVGVIGGQAWVGRLIVTNDLDADLVSVHLAISMLVVALLTIVVVNTAAEPSAAPRPDNRQWTILLASGAAGALTVLLLGSYVHNLYISGWPLVGDELLPRSTHRLMIVHYLHRALAGVGIIYLVYLSRQAVRRKRPLTEGALVHYAGLAYLVNVLLGAANVFTRVDSSVVIAAHLLMAALVWTTLVAATTMAHSAQRLRSASATASTRL